MALNPIWNTYAVAPVGANIVIGHKRALHSGISRESAINLIAWLTIAAQATPEEIAAELAKANSATPHALPPGQRIAPATPARAAETGGGKTLAKQVSVTLRPSPRYFPEWQEGDPMPTPDEVGRAMSGEKMPRRPPSGPVVERSAAPEGEGQGEAEAPGNGHVTKPVDADALARAWPGAAKA
jgi:hypothetical protein